MKNYGRIISTFVILLSVSIGAQAENLYQVSLLRASPGLMPELIEMVKQRKTQLKNEMIIMRHSQGDHWDLMLLAPANNELPESYSYQSKADFQHDFLASSDIAWDAIGKLAKDADLFHIEMFQAAKGLYPELLAQRHMENEYLEATQRQANIIFQTKFGSDTDLFTLGIYADMQAFAAEPDLAPEVFEKAAVDAGFKARSDIGFYLRRFLVGHQDTLASQIK